MKRQHTLLLLAFPEIIYNWSARRRQLSRWSVNVAKDTYGPSKCGLSVQLPKCPQYVLSGFARGHMLIPGLNRAAV